MSAPSRLPPGAAGALAWARKSVYGPGYRLARAAAFRRSGGTGGICQLCGLSPAEEAHHWACRYPADGLSVPLDRYLPPGDAPHAGGRVVRPGDRPGDTP